MQPVDAETCRVTFRSLKPPAEAFTAGGIWDCEHQ